MQQKVRDIAWLLTNYLPFLESFGMNETNIKEHYTFWKKNKEERIEDYLWYIFNKLLDENQIQSENLASFYQRNLKIYSEMINFRRRFEGKKANDIQALYNLTSVHFDLESEKLSSFERVFKIIGCDDCEYSQNLSGQSVTIEEALENRTIPYNDCQRRQGCVCGIAITAKRDERGGLIYKI